ncbi:MAG: hypothetical protein IJX78_02255, partial [Bacilli bacterium]|nr:hypothetical protein [Bacilli bacterium]
MKKYIKLLLIMFLLIMISGCNEPNKESTSYRHLFDDLYERNFKKAEKVENWGLDSEEPIKYITYDFTEGGREEIPDFVFEQKIMTSDEIARVIL